MHIEWHALATGFALYLVLEGVLPFLSPSAMKRAVGALLDVPETRLRVFGLLSMGLGCALLYLIRT
jgi:uncharacterized protein YjeT (DUF2065 family)